MGAASSLAGICAALLVLTGCASHQAPSDDGPGVPLADGSDKAVSDVVDAITMFPTELDPRIWSGTEMKPEVRDMSLKVIDRIVKTSGIDGLSVDAVELFGSNASYEYDDASDYGLHVFAHAASLPPKQLEGVLRLLNDEVERRQEGHIRFNGVVVEVTFHGERSEGYKPQLGIGQYSLSEGRWIQLPVQQPDHYDRAQMTADIKKYIGRYNDLASAYAANKKGFDCSRFGDLDAEMSAYRNEAFAAGAGSRSTQNLAYRALRRINVDIPRMVDTLEDECIFTNESIG